MHEKFNNFNGFCGMKWQGKFVGGCTGFLLGGGIPGFIIGVIIGHLFDSGMMQNWLTPPEAFDRPSHNHSTQRVFFETTFAIMGYLAKADGRVSESEIEAAKRVMQYMSLSEDMRREAIMFFNEGKQPNFNWQAYVQDLREACRFNANLLRAFIEFQLQIVFASGGITSAKRIALQRICEQLGISRIIFSQFEQQSQAEQHYRREQTAEVNPQYQIADAYQILGVTANNSNEEIKRAYRRLLSKNHPDKLVAQGLPPEMMKLANEKTQRIKKAYETIKQARNIN